MSKDTRFVVFFPYIGGTNTQHYFKTYEDAEKYCKGVNSNTVIAFVLASNRVVIEKSTDSEKLLNYVKTLDVK